MATPSASLPRWDLSDLYSGPNDPAIEQQLTNVERKAQAFERSYRGTITDRASDLHILKAIRSYESIVQSLVKPSVYAALVHAADLRNPTHGALVQRVEQRSMEIYHHLRFFELGIAQLRESTLTRLVKSKTLLPYRHYLEKQREAKPHRLSEAEEKIMADLSLTGRSAFHRLYDEEFAHTSFFLPKKPKRPFTEEQILDRLHAPKQKDRAEAAKGFTQGLRSEVRRLTFITNTLAQEKRTTDRYQRFDAPEDSRHLENEIERKIVDAMVSAVTSSYDIVQDFYRFKRSVLGLKKLYDYDRYAPMAESETKYSFSQGRDIVLRAFTEFSSPFGKTAQQFFDKRWIDAPSLAGKRGGAFCMFVTPDEHPYVFLNYTGSLKHILVMAHELGHGVHAALARKQSMLNFDMPLTVAETASVFGEMIVFDALTKTIKNPKELFALYVHQVENIFASVFRQTSMFLFERDLHAAARERGELRTEEINAIWRTRQVEMFGNSVTLTPDYDLWWSYIPHFIHTPFYVYAYTFGELLTLSLFAEYKKRGKAMAKEYLNLLSSGGSVSPQELVAPFGLRLDDPAFWKSGIELIRELVKEAKRLQKA